MQLDVQYTSVLSDVLSSAGVCVWCPGRCVARKSELLVEHKFCFLVTAQIYGKFETMYEKKVHGSTAAQRGTADGGGMANKREALCYLMKCYPSLRVAYIDEKEVSGEKHFWSVLLHGLDQHDAPVELYRVRLPGNPVRS